MILSLLYVFVASPEVDGPHCTQFDTGKRPAPIYGLLIGHPEAPGLKRLNKVEQDVAEMTELLNTWGAEKIFVHLEDPSAVDAFSTRIVWRRANLQSIAESVADLTSLSRAGGQVAPQFFVYYAGHGREEITSEWRRSTSIFLAPTESSDDGRVTSRMFNNLILSPLENLGELHLIVDACQSLFILEPRGVDLEERIQKSHPENSDDTVATFTLAHPRVGALVATNGGQETFEDPRVGGLFSYAVRSALLGPGDLNNDGAISYAEASRAIPQILAGYRGMIDPGFAPPAADESRILIDFRGRALSRVCFDQRSAGRYELRDGRGRHFAVVHPGRQHIVSAYYNKVGGGDRWNLATVEGRGPLEFIKFRAAAGFFADMARDVFEADTRGTNDEFVGRMLPEPLDPTITLNSRARRSLAAAPPKYMSFAAAGGGWWIPKTNFLNMNSAFGASASVRGGYGANQLALHIDFNRGSGVIYPLNPTPHVTQILSASLGYERALMGGAFELNAGAFFGAEWFSQKVVVEERKDSIAFLLGASATAYLPLQYLPSLAPMARIRVSARYLCKDAVCGDAEISPVLWFSIGADWEFSVQ